MGTGSVLFIGEVHNLASSTTAEALLRCYRPGSVRGAALTLHPGPTGRQMRARLRQSGASDATGRVAAEQRLRCGRVARIKERNLQMSGRCEVCERKPMHGNNVSFSQRRTRRRFVLNVHRRHIEINGVVRTVNICTRCLRTMSKLPK